MSSIRWLAALLWTVLTLILMLTPGLPTPYTFLGDLTDKAGHLALFCVLAMLWSLALSSYLPMAKAFRFALGAAILFGGFTELGQYFVPGRDVALLDFAANTLGVGLGAVIVYWRSARMATA
jgi:VanZ family protein